MAKKFVNPPGMKPLGIYTQVTVAQSKVVCARGIQAQAVQVFEKKLG